MDNNGVLELLNPEFVFKFNGKEYQVRKANLKQAILYREKIKELKGKDQSLVDVELLAYCIYLILSKADANITEDQILENIPGNLDVLEYLEILGFMNPQQAKKANQMIGEKTQ